MVKGCRSAAFIAVALSALLALSPAESFAVGVQETVVGSSATVSEGSSLPPTSSGKGDAGKAERSALADTDDSRGDSQLGDPSLRFSEIDTYTGKGISDNKSLGLGQREELISEKPSKDVTGDQPTEAPLDSAAKEFTDNPAATPVEDSVADSIETPESVPLAISPLADGIGPQALATGCEYADAGTGTYASTLCWLDLSTITTEYQQQSIGSYTCPRSGSSYTCTVTTTWVSKLGSAYGSASGTGTGTASSNQTTARNNALAAAKTNLATKLYASGSTFFGPVTNYPLTVQVSDIYMLEANLSITASAGTGALAVVASGFPTYSGSFLGNSGFYTITDPNVKPALYQLTSGTTTATLSNIKLMTEGAAVQGYSIVVADAESSDVNEQITWSAQNAALTSSRAFTWLPNNPGAWKNATTNAARRAAAVGNSCGGNTDSDWAHLNPANSGNGNEFSCKGQSTSGGKTGTALLQVSPANTTANFSVTQQMVGGGRQAIAFGVIASGGQINVNVDGRIVDAVGSPSTTDFVASITRGSDTRPFATTATGTSALAATTGSHHFPVAAGTQTLLFASAPSPNDTIAAAYIPAWVCDKSTTTGPVRWPATGTRSQPPSKTTDLAFLTIGPGEFIECTVTYTPPFLTLVKSVDKAATAASDGPERWALTADQVGMSKANAVGSGTRVAVAPGTYSLSEASNELAWPHGYRWSGLTCSGATPVVTQDQTSKAVTSASVAVVKGGDVTCTYTNTANEPKLNLLKTASDAAGNLLPSGSTLGGERSLKPGDTLTYTLTFDNTMGSAPMAVNHVDYLRDVLDDATYAGNIRYGRLAPSVVAPRAAQLGITAQATNVADAANPRMTFTGAVPAYTSLTVLFDVKLKANETDWQAREKGNAGATGVPAAVGFELNNYFVPSGDPVPTRCAVQGEAAKTCTTHPVLAWTTEKDSQPLNNASLHVGGDLHYKITVRKLNTRAQGDISGIVVSDDLTDVFTYSRWYPSAPVPYPARQRGIYFYDADGHGVIPNENKADGSANPTNRLPNRATDGAGVGASRADIAAADEYVHPPVFTPRMVEDPALPSPVDPENPSAKNWGECPANVRPPGAPGPTNPACFNGTWELTTEAFTLPSDAAYAEVWFSVKIGFHTDPDDQAAVTWSDDSSISGGNWMRYWVPRRQAATRPYFVNTATIDQQTAASSVAPVSCGVDEARKSPENPTGSLCAVQQKVDANYFVIRKDLIHRVGDVVVRDINLVGHQLKLYMELDGQQIPVDEVCTVRDEFGGVLSVYEETGGGCSGANVTPLMCEDWNEAEPNSLPGESCARFRPIPEGAQAGRWRADRFPQGTYWLEETSVPTAIRTGPGRWDDAPGTGNTTRVSGAQMLPERVKFRVSGGETEEQKWLWEGETLASMQSPAGQLDVFDPQATDGRDVHPRCQIPYRQEGSDISSLPTACINPTGYVMVLTDVAPMPLPRAGGAAINTTIAGVFTLALALVGTVWWRRKKAVA